MDEFKKNDDLEKEILRLISENEELSNKYIEELKEEKRYKIKKIKSYNKEEKFDWIAFLIMFAFYSTTSDFNDSALHILKYGYYDVMNCFFCCMFAIKLSDTVNYFKNIKKLNKEVTSLDDKINELHNR